MAKTELVTTNGHNYLIRKATLGDQMRLMDWGVDAKNEAYFNVCLFCYAVEEMDGVPLPPVKDREGLIRRGEMLDEAAQVLAEAFARLNGADAATQELAAVKN